MYRLVVRGDQEASVMGRLFLCLPLCLLLQDQGPLQSGDVRGDTDAGPASNRALQRRVELCSHITSSLAAAPVSYPATLPWLSLWQLSKALVPRHHAVSRDVADSLGALAPTGALTLAPLQATLCKHGPGLIEDLCEADPVRFLQLCLAHYQREVTGYISVMHKTERLNGKLHPKEEIDAHFREKPFSVHMEWTA